MSETLFSMLTNMQGKGLSATLWQLNRFTLGRLFSILRGDIGYAWWRLHHWDARFSSYYAASITKKLDQGRPHRTLGKKRHGPTNFLAGGEILTPSSAQQHGRFAFKKIVELGLQPHHVCVDYGCGSLRVGQHLIDYLEPNRYWGLDVTDRFFRDGLDLLDDGINHTKTPHLGVIEQTLLKQVADFKPDYIICVSVLMHVPPHELDSFFDKLLGLMATHTRLLLFFDEASYPIRTEAKSWAYSVVSLTEHIFRRHAATQVFCKSGSLKGRIAKNEFRRSILIIEGGQEKRPALPEKHPVSSKSGKVPFVR